jgi:hypothetical protein
MDYTAPIVVPIILLFVFLPIYGALRIGVRVGAKRSIKNIVDGYYIELDKETLSELSQQVGELQSALKEHNGWYDLLGTDFDIERKTKNIGSALWYLGIEAGELFHEKRTAKKQQEVDIRMDREALKHIAWLADYGHRVWTDPNTNQVRLSMERLTKDRAERMATELDTFERRIAVDDWPNEAGEDKEMRFNVAFNRQQRMWEAYPDFDAA